MTDVDNLTDEQLEVYADKMETDELQLWLRLFTSIANEAEERGDKRVHRVHRQIIIMKRVIDKRKENVVIGLDSLNLTAKKN